ncbi:MAG: response regulator [Acidobacteriota bacterium]|nr:response regulator [Acidobacteriota bacterium]
MPPPPTAPDRVPLRVLVIDDDSVMRRLLPLLLNAEGHTVTSAESGDAALKHLETVAPRHLPSVLLVDLKMPGLSATTLAIRLRRVCGPSALLIAMSATAATPAEVACFDAFLHKPFTADDFAVALARVRTCAQARESTAAHDDPPPALDRNIFAKLAAVIAAAELQQVYKLLLDDVPLRLDRMRSAAEARDEATFIREAHAIKGGCGMLGAAELQALAQRMEVGGLASSFLLADFQPAVDRVRRILEMHLDP